MTERNPRLNASGYNDPTAYLALEVIRREESEQDKRVNDLIKAIKYITRLAGFELIGRVGIRDKVTGREYR